MPYEMEIDELIEEKIEKSDSETIDQFFNTSLLSNNKIETFKQLLCFNMD